MIILDFKLGASNLFIKIRDEGRDLDIYFGGYSNKKVIHPYRSQNITRIPQSNSEYPSSLPIVKNPILTFFCDFYDCLFGLEGVGVQKK